MSVIIAADWFNYVSVIIACNWLELTSVVRGNGFKYMGFIGVGLDGYLRTGFCGTCLRHVIGFGFGILRDRSISSSFTFGGVWHALWSLVFVPVKVWAVVLDGRQRVSRRRAQNGDRRRGNTALKNLNDFLWLVRDVNLLAGNFHFGKLGVFA